LAKTIAEYLKPEGHDVYWDFESLKHGSDFNETISSLIADSDLVVFLASPQVFQSKWVAAELAYAKALQKTVIPIKIEGVSNEQIEGMPFIGKVHILEWPTNKNIKEDILAALSKSDLNKLMSVVFKKLDEKSFVIDVNNNSPVDLYDVSLTVCVLWNDNGSYRFEEPMVRRHAWVRKDIGNYSRFEIKEFLPEVVADEKNLGKFYSSGHRVHILCKFCFQNQERYFYIFKEVVVDDKVVQAEK